MKANPDKCHLSVATNTLASVNINGFQIINSTEEKLVGIKFDSKLSFENHVLSLCKKTSQKLRARTQDYQLYESFQTKSCYENLRCIPVSLLPISLDVSQ